MFLCILLSLDHVNSGYIRDVMFRVIYKLKQASVKWLYGPCTHSHSELYLSKV